MSGASKRQYGLWLALALTAAATLWTAQAEKNEDVELVAAPRPADGTREREPGKPRAGSARRAMQVAAAAPDSMMLDLAPLQRPRIGNAPGELFDSALPPARQAELDAAAPPPPTVPPLPYVYAGKLIDGDNYIVFLTHGDKNYSVRVGDTLGDWRVKAIRPPQMILSYLPMQAEVPLKIGEAN